jgi:hypothetical protein
MDSVITVRIPAALVLLAGCGRGGPPPQEPPPEPPRMVAFAPDPGDAAVPAELRGFCQGERPGAAPAGPWAPREFRWTRPQPALAHSGYRKGGTRFQRPLRCVVRTPAEWSALVAHSGLPDRALRPINFGERVVLVATQGVEPSGYIAVDSLYYLGDTLTAVVMQSRTGLAPNIPGESTVPLSLVQAPAPAGPVRFLERSRGR